MTDDEIKVEVEKVRAWLAITDREMANDSRMRIWNETVEVRLRRAFVALADRKLRVPDDNTMTKIITEAISPGWDRDDRAEFVRDAINAELKRREL